MALVSHVRLQRRLLRMQQLYDFTMHAYLELRRELESKVASRELSIDSHIPSAFGLFKTRPVRQIVGHASSLYPDMLRSTLLVRLITHLEVFLTDAVLEVADYDFAPFSTATRVNVERQQLLSNDTLRGFMKNEIAKDVRVLTSGGFDKIRAYYQQHFSLDLVPPSATLDAIREMHARRHLHVHRGGVADAQYVHEFQTTLEAGDDIGVPDDYLRTCFAIVAQIGAQVSDHLERTYPRRATRIIRGTTQVLQSAGYVYSLHAIFPSDEAIVTHFAVTRLVTQTPKTELGEILVAASVEHRRVRWLVAGTKEQVGPYIGALHKQSEGDELDDFHCVRIQPP